MKRAPYTLSPDHSEKNYWRSLKELEQPEALKEEAQREFPEGVTELPAIDVNRRGFLTLLGASASLAAASGCRRPEEKILPYTRAPEYQVPGRPELYATAVPWMGTAVGLLVESHENRPTKIEGNPLHADSQGAASAFLQSVVLELYDPDRSFSPSEKGANRSWDDAKSALRKRLETHRGNGGQGLALLMEPHRSPTVQGQLDALKKAFPSLRVYRYEPQTREHMREGARLAFGTPLETVLFAEKAKVLVGLDSDFLHGEMSALRNTRGFTRNRKLEKPGDTMNRLYVAESAFTLTGANADHRARLPSHKVGALAFALARELASQGVDLGADVVSALSAYSADGLGPHARFVKALAKDLAQNQGAGLVVAGISQPPAVHAVVHLINRALGNTGKTLTHVQPFSEDADGPRALMPLAEGMKKGEVQTLIILGGNPAFSAPVDADFEAALQKVPFSVHLSFDINETSKATTWHLTRAHDLETWGDVRSDDGTASIVQPLIAPMFSGRTDGELISILLGEDRRAYDLVRATWQALTGADFEKTWRRSLHDGVIAGTAFPPAAPEVRSADAVTAIKGLGLQGQGLEVTYRPDSHAFDGRFSNVGWMQEMPDPMTKTTWDNVALVSPATAKRIGLNDADLVSIAVPKGVAVRIPVAIAPGQADDSIALCYGQGRKVVGRVGEQVGANVYPARTSTEPYIAQGATLQRVTAEHQLARTQEHAVMEGRPMVRETSLAKWEKDPDFAQQMVQHPPLLSLFPDWEYKGHKWGMSIDLNSCIGCNACMVACQSENNIPIVGKWGVKFSREMHWIRIDRYYEGGTADDPNAVFQPTPCMHCETAPCEQVCPVAATTHSPEGLNDMAYNRCIGTRYCANNCPYKVRRFNYFNYAKDFRDVKDDRHGKFLKDDLPEIRKAQFNPDVTVRSRGVMEKCTYCVQRISEAKRVARIEGERPIKDGEIVPACAQTCPGEAIVFGDLNDPMSRVAKLKSQPRDYGLLTEINTRPRTTYLAKIRNPNPELESA